MPEEFKNRDFDKLSRSERLALTAFVRLKKKKHHKMIKDELIKMGIEFDDSL